MSKSFMTLEDLDRKWIELMRKNSEVSTVKNPLLQQKERVLTIKKYSSCPAKLDALDITYYNGIPVGVQEVKLEPLGKRRVKSCEIQ